MALPSFMYYDPAKAAERIQGIELKHDQGCRVCKHRRRDRVFGQTVCSYPARKPGPLGYCKRFELTDE